MVLLLATSLLAQDKKLVAWSTFIAASAAADVETTQQVINRPGDWHEINPILGRHPSRLRMYTTIGAIDSAVMFGAWKLKKSGKRYWWALPAAAVAIHAGGTMFSVGHL